jgi:glycosyltransferase involved in cell wall biosynthesis
VAEQQTPQLWNGNQSLQDIRFEPRPVQSDISIVIPTLGRDILEQCLYWIFMGSVWPGCLIVVNQGNTESVEGWLRYVETMGVTVKHIISKQKGRSAGINRGLEQVETTYVAITDDDCFVDTDWLQNMVSVLCKTRMTVVTGRVEAAGEDMIVVVTSPVPAEYHKPRLKFDSMSGGNMGTSLAVFQKVGLFDEDPCMQTAEDAEWSYRALRNNIAIRYEPSVCLWHFGWRDPEKRMVQYRHYALSHGGFYGKYLRKGDLFILIRALLHFFRALRRWVSSRKSTNPDQYYLGRAYFLYMLPGIFAGLRSNLLPDQLK